MATTDPATERQRLAQVYGGMADGELAKLAEDAGSLTHAARDILQLEVSRRGLKIELREPVAAPEPAQGPRLIILRQYMNLPEALVAKSILDSAGVEAFLGDQNMIRMDWFLSNALGGVKLLVREEDAEAAATLLDRSGEDAPEV